MRTSLPVQVDVRRVRLHAPDVPLDPDEIAARDEALAAEAAGARGADGDDDESVAPGPPVVTSVRIWRALLFIPFFAAAALAVLSVELGSPLAALLVIFVALLYGMSVRRRVARYRFDDTGALYLDDEDEPLDWASTAQITVRRRAPWATPRSRRRLADSVLDVRIALLDGTEIRFARGDHFVEGDSRRPLTPGVFERWLEGRAVEAKLQIDRVGDTGFIARR